MTYNSPQSGGWSVPDPGSSGGPYQQNPGGYQDPNAGGYQDPTSGYPASGSGGYQDPSSGGYQQQDPYQGAPSSGYPNQGGFNDPYQQQNAGFNPGGYQDPNYPQDPYGGGFNQGPQKTGPSTGLIVGIIAAVAVLIGLGIGGFFLLSDDDSGDKKSSSKEEETKDPEKTKDPEETDRPTSPSDAPYSYDMPRGYEETDVPSAMDIPGLDATAINDSSSSSDAIIIGHMSSFGQPDTALTSFIEGTGLGAESFTPLPGTVDGADGSVHESSDGVIYVFANDEYLVLIVTENTSSDAKDAMEEIIDSFTFE